LSEGRRSHSTGCVSAPIINFLRINKQEGMAKRSKGEVVSIRGPAHLAYIALDESEDNHAFQGIHCYFERSIFFREIIIILAGHVIDSSTKQCFGFMATRTYLIILLLLNIEISFIYALHRN
jgi:hypothetical protein